MIPEMVERHWFLQFLHNQRGSVLKALLYLKGNQRIICDQRAVVPEKLASHANRDCA
jgi:hypothetical protein